MATSVNSYTHPLKTFSIGDDPLPIEYAITRRDTGMPKDLTNHLGGTWWLYPLDDIDNPVLVKAFGDGLDIQGNADDGIVVVTLTAADQASITPAAAYVGQLQIQDSAGVVRTVARGPWVFLAVPPGA